MSEVAYKSFSMWWGMIDMTLSVRFITKLAIAGLAPSLILFSVTYHVHTNNDITFYSMTHNVNSNWLNVTPCIYTYPISLPDTTLTYDSSPLFTITTTLQAAAELDGLLGGEMGHLVRQDVGEVVREHIQQLRRLEELGGNYKTKILY